MIKTKNRKKIGGAIVNMSSQMGHVGGPIRSVYNMNKWGLEGLTKGMGVELAKKNINQDDNSNVIKFSNFKKN